MHARALDVNDGPAECSHSACGDRTDAYEPTARLWSCSSAAIAWPRPRSLYHLPDHPGLLQTFVWQHYDLEPEFPELRKFLDFWVHNIEGKLHSVPVARRRLIGPAEHRHAAGVWQLH